MKKIIIVAPHFAPSNLAAVHRSRLFANHLKDFGWEPIIVTVNHKYYEEQLDWKLNELISPDQRIERTGAISTKRLRIIGDIGIRGFYPMLKRIKDICKNEKIDFIYITIPSHFAALLGRFVLKLTGVPYGIDYIDPWVHTWPGTEIKYSKHWWSMKLAEWLEPFAVKKASLITGVAEGYYKDVILRNPHLAQHTIMAAMPYGGEQSDHIFVAKTNAIPYLFSKQKDVIDLVYAGAMLPRAYEPLHQVLKYISANRELFAKIRFHFIGTGKSPNDPIGFNIKPVAEQYDLWDSVIFEYPKRIPYLDVLTHLNAADGVFILGSTEAHYTPSKVFQSVLAEKPIFAVLHSESTATHVIRETKSGTVLDFNGETDLFSIADKFETSWSDFLKFLSTYNPKLIDLKNFEQYSAKNVSKILADALNKAVNIRK